MCPIALKALSAPGFLGESIGRWQSPGGSGGRGEGNLSGYGIPMYGSHAPAGEKKMKKDETLGAAGRERTCEPFSVFGMRLPV